MTRSRVLVLLPAVMLVSSGCAVPNMFDKPDEVTIVDPGTVYVQGLRFARAPGFEAVTAQELEEGAKEDAGAQNYAASLGMDKAAFVQLMSSYDLYMIDAEAKRAYPDNISVASPAGAMPDDEAVASQLAELGATHVKFADVDTGMGTLTTARFELRVGKRPVFGHMILVDHHGPVVITASSNKAKGAAKLADQIIDTIGESDSPYAD